MSLSRIELAFLSWYFSLYSSVIFKSLWYSTNAETYIKVWYYENELFQSVLSAFSLRTT